MADARLGQTNPLSLIGRSAAAPQSNEALQKLAIGSTLQGLANQGQLDVMKLQGVNTLRNTGLGQSLNITPEQAGTGNLGVGNQSRLDLRNSAGTAAASGQAANALRGAGIGLKFPSASFSAGQFANQPLTGADAAGNRLQTKGQLAAEAKAVAELSNQNIVEEPELVLPDGTVIPTPRMRTRTTKSGSKLQTTSKAPSTATDIFQATEQALAAVGLKRGTFKGKTVIFRELGDGKREIVATQP